MSTVLTVLAAIGSAVLLIVGMIRVSIWITDRKSSAELAFRMADGSDSNHDGKSIWDGGCGGGD